MAYTSSIEFTAKQLRFLKFMGLLPITIINGKSVTKPTDIIFLIVSISFGIYISYFFCIRREEFSTSKSDIANLGNFISFFASIWISIIIMIVSFIFRHRTWKTYSKLGATEDKVRELFILLNF